MYTYLGSYSRYIPIFFYLCVCVCARQEIYVIFFVGLKFIIKVEIYSYLRISSKVYKL